MRDKTRIILTEIERVFEGSNFQEVPSFVGTILKSNSIITFGAGRVGLMMRSFSMRLAHLGLNSFFLLDTNVPRIGKGDTLIVGSGSGNTISVAEMAELAAKREASILLLTANRVSRVASIATSAITLNAQTKAYENDRPKSIQPMTTLFEQSLLLTLDSLVLEIMKLTKQKNSDLESRHNVLE
jgi:6-phospho-3-hexuloisomerase